MRIKPGELRQPKWVQGGEAAAAGGVEEAMRGWNGAQCCANALREFVSGRGEVAQQLLLRLVSEKVSE